MSDLLISTISIILLLAGMLGTIIPILPGLILSLTGLLLFKFGTDSSMSIYYIWIFSFLTIISAVIGYIIPAQTNKKYGGTRWGSIGSFIGTIAGLFLIPVPFGFLIGMLLGVAIGELLHDINDKQKAFNSVKGALIGFLYGTSFNLMVGMAMLLIVIYYIFI